MLLLALRSTFKEGSMASVAELVYGMPLALPGDLVTGSAKFSAFPSHSFIEDLRRRMAETVQPPLFHHRAKNLSLPTLPLQDSPYVFVRRGPKPGPLQAPYEGPFEVLEFGDKHCVVKVKGKDEIITTDRLKPAFMMPT